jgi:hypothetical protein
METNASYPSSYTTNCKKEEITLAYVENVRMQFKMIFPRRAELFLSPLSECGAKVYFYFISPHILYISPHFFPEICVQDNLSEYSSVSRRVHTERLREVRF